MKSAADKQRASDFYRVASRKEMVVVEDMIARRQYWQALWGMPEAKERQFYVGLSESLNLEAEGKPIAEAYANQPLRDFIEAIESRVLKIFAVDTKENVSVA